MGWSSLHEEREEGGVVKRVTFVKCLLLSEFLFMVLEKRIQSYLKICVVSTTGACWIPSPAKKQKEKKNNHSPGHFSQAKIVISSFLFE